jgi:hypothetical protein
MVGLLELAKQLGNSVPAKAGVSQAYNMMGYSRDSFFASLGEADCVQRAKTHLMLAPGFLQRNTQDFAPAALTCK